jgi:dephospho-CoA kinase
LADRIIVLTGGIGSGKTEAAKMFEQHGITVVDADAISRALTASGGEAIPAIRAALGPDAIDADGSMRRAYIRQAAFSDPQVRQRLEAILHPMIAARALQALMQSSSPYAVYAVPLWLEKYGPGKGASPGIKPEAIVVVDCDDETRVARVAQRSQMSRQEILAIMASQASRDERLAAADAVLDNSTSLESLAQQVHALHQGLIAP